VIVVARNPRGERRLSPSQYKLVLTAHIMVSVGWLGVVAAKVVLGVAAMTARTPDVAAALFVGMNVMNVAFPPLAIGTVVTGVVLSLGTKWGLVQHYWVVTKLTLTVGVIATAVQLTDRLVRLAGGAPGAAGVDASALLGTGSAPALLTYLAMVHLLMLGAATVLSVYKPWGRTGFGRRQSVPQAPRVVRSG
jgi:hypothetical protein